MKPLLQAKEDFLNHLSNKESSKETIDGYNKDIKMLNKFLSNKYNGEIFVDEITTDDIEGYMTFLKQERQLKPVSRNRYLSSVSSLFTYCVKQELIEKNPTDKVDKANEPKKERVFLTKDELERLMSNMSHHPAKTAVQFMIRTGTRVSETINLTFDQLDLDNQEVRIGGKGDKERIIPISDELLVELKYYFNEFPNNESEYVFSLKRTGGISAQTCNDHIKAATKRANIKKHVTNHILRHSFATQLLNQDVSLYDLQMVLGHASLDTTSVYLHTTVKRLHKAVSKF